MDADRSDEIIAHVSSPILPWRQLEDFDVCHGQPAACASQ